MSYQTTYGQYCPLAMSSEFLCQRWMMLILRELLEGSNTFNDISRGVPRMSRSLLSKRLKEMVEIGIIQRQDKPFGHHIEYIFTEAGRALEPVVMSMASWGQRWLKIEPAVEKLDINLLMWDIRRHTQPMPELPDPFTVHIFFTDTEEKFSNHWLIYREGKVDLCYIDKGFDVDVYIETEAQKLAKVWMGWEKLDQAISDKSFLLEGPKKYTDLAQKWLGQSSVANVSKVKKELRIA